jgi:hypothetical protein
VLASAAAAASAPTKRHVTVPQWLPPLRPLLLLLLLGCQGALHTCCHAGNATGELNILHTTGSRKHEQNSHSVIVHFMSVAASSVTALPKEAAMHVVWQVGKTSATTAAASAGAHTVPLPPPPLLLLLYSTQCCCCCCLPAPVLAPGPLQSAQTPSGHSTHCSSSSRGSGSRAVAAGAVAAARATGMQHKTCTSEVKCAWCAAWVEELANKAHKSLLHVTCGATTSQDSMQCDGHCVLLNHLITV